MDKDKLQELLDAAGEARSAYETATRAIENYIGKQCYALDLTTDDMVDMPAEYLIELVTWHGIPPGYQPPY